MTPSAIVDVSTSDPGVLESINVKRSDKVIKNQLLAQIESEVEKVDLEIASAQANMDAVVKLREVSVNYDERSLKRIQSLHGKKMISTDISDKAKKEAELAKWRLQDAKDLLIQRKLQLKRAQAALERRKIYSPIDGIVLQILRQPGEYIEEQPIVRVAQLDPLFVEVILPMSLFGQLEPGMQAIVKPELENAEPLPAKVHVVDPIGDAASGTFGIRLELPNPNYRIPAGVKCQVQFSDLVNTPNDFDTYEDEMDKDSHLNLDFDKIKSTFDLNR